MTRKRRVGVIGSIVWDVIYGRDPRSFPIEEWGGISYALERTRRRAAGRLGDRSDHQGRRRSRAGARRSFSATLQRIATDAARDRGAVSQQSRRAALLRRRAAERGDAPAACPAWNWLGLKPVLETARLDALYINFLSGWELDLETTKLIRQHFRGPIYCDLHMLVWAVQPMDCARCVRSRTSREWCGCFDLLQVNEDEMAMLAPIRWRSPRRRCTPASAASSSRSASAARCTSRRRTSIVIERSDRSAASHSRRASARCARRSCRAGPHRRRRRSDRMRRRVGRDLFLSTARR